MKPEPYGLDMLPETEPDTPPVDESIGFTGTRRGMTEFQKQSLEDKLRQMKRDFVWFHHGSCLGSDLEAHRIARQLGYKIALHPPADKYCAAELRSDSDYVYFDAEYLTRDREIVNQSTFLIAAPKKMIEERRSGTWFTVRYARSVGKHVHILAVK